MKILTLSGSLVKDLRVVFQVNCNDDDGVLVGNWSGEYGDGKTPGSWSGSPAILHQYWNDKSVVKYGQCWVFSGLTTTGNTAVEG